MTQYLEVLRKRFKNDILNVRLFGSFVRGDYDSESDVDILVVVKKNDWKFKSKVAMLSFDPELKNLVVLSPLVMDRREFNWYKEYRDPLYNQIEKYGTDLWTKT